MDFSTKNAETQIDSSSSSTNFGQQCDIAPKEVMKEVERIVEKIVEKIVEVEKIIERPIISERIITVEKIIEKPITIEIEKIQVVEKIV